MQTAALLRINPQRQTIDRDCTASVKAIVCKHHPITPVRGGPVRTQAETPCGRPPLQLRCCALVCASAVRAAGARDPGPGASKRGPPLSAAGSPQPGRPQVTQRSPKRLPPAPPACFFLWQCYLCVAFLLLYSRPFPPRWGNDSTATAVLHGGPTAAVIDSGRRPVDLPASLHARGNDGGAAAASTSFLPSFTAHVPPPFLPSRGSPLAGVVEGALEGAGEGGGGGDEGEGCTAWERVAVCGTSRVTTTSRPSHQQHARRGSYRSRERHSQCIWVVAATVGASMHRMGGGVRGRGALHCLSSVVGESGGGWVEGLGRGFGGWCLSSPSWRANGGGGERPLGVKPTSVQQLGQCLFLCFITSCHPSHRTRSPTPPPPPPPTATQLTAYPATSPL